MSLQRSVGLLVLVWNACCPAASGPVMMARTADHLLDSFESDQPSYATRVRGKAKFTATVRAGIARHGNRSLLLRIEPSGEERARNSVTLRWLFPEPVDWSDYAGVSVWMQNHADPPPSIATSVYETNGASYWWRRPPLQPRREGDWQLVEMPFEQWTWNWEARKDDNGHLDLNSIRSLQMEIRAHADTPVVLGIDAVGVYNPRPAYDGPKLRILSPESGGASFIRPPGEDFRLQVEVRNLKPRQEVEVEIVGTDFWGAERVHERLPFTGTDAPRLVKSLSIPNRGPGYLELTGRLQSHGAPVYRWESGIACIPPPDPEDAKPNPDSIFGIWVGGFEQRIGAKWTRLLVRINSIKKVGDSFQMGDGPPGKPVPKYGWGAPEMNRIVCFVTMAKWLSSKPDRADYYKWSPTDWEEYARLIRFVVRGASAAGVRHYEVWNEPVPYAGWMGSIESVVKLHQVTYEAIKSVQPEARVLGPCPYTFLWPFLEQFFDKGGAQCIDDVVVHAYDANPPDVNFPSHLRKLREVMRRYGLGDRDIYITEMGYATPHVTERMQAQYLVRAYAYAIASGVKAFIWHMLWDYRGVRDPANYTGAPRHAVFRFDKSPRPAAVAYATMTRILERAAYVGPAPGLTGTQRGFEFRKRGRHILLLWEPGDKPTKWSMKVAAPVTGINMLGRTEKAPVSSGGRLELTLSNDPVYLTW